MRPQPAVLLPAKQRFQSTHPVRGATAVGAVIAAVNIISIHAPRAGCDRARQRSTAGTVLFQSTHPVRGATRQRLQHDHPPYDFNPRTPCGVRLRASGAPPARSYFNPRTPCGVRLFSLTCQPRIFYFNPRTPCGVRPIQHQHQPGAEYFNPRTPCGVRHLQATASAIQGAFQSTHPVRGATLADLCRFKWSCNFNPRTPCGVRQSSAEFATPLAISIHAPRAGCDPRSLATC